MATDPVPSQGAVIQAQLSNNQQLADGLPSYKIYKNPAGSPRWPARGLRGRLRTTGR